MAAGARNLTGPAHLRMRNEVLQAGCVVLHGSEVVLRRTREGHLVFPKGHVARGESAEEAAVREVAEETGLSVRLERYLGDIRFVQEGEPRQVSMFLARVTGELPTWPSHLGADTVLLSPEAVDDALSFENSRAIWAQVLAAEDWQKEL